MLYTMVSLKLVAVNDEMNFKVEEILFPSTRLLRKVDANNLIVVDISNKDAIAKFLGKEVVQKFVDDSVNNGIVYNGDVFVPLMMGASNARQGKYLACSKSVYADVMEYVSMGFKMDGLSTSKASKYFALSMSSDMEWSKGCDFAPCPSLRRTAVVNDIDCVWNGVVDTVTTNTISRAKRDIAHKVSDGVIYLIVDDTKLNNADRRELVNKIDAFTVRHFGTKGLMVPVLRTEVNRMIHFEGGNKTFNTIYGVKNIDDIDVIMFKSSFKWSKVIKTEDQWNEFVSRCENGDQKFTIAVTPHEHIKPMAYQPTGLMSMTNDRLMYYIDRIVCQFDKYQSNPLEIIKGSKLAKAIELCPDLMKDRYIQHQIKATYVSKYREVLGGKQPAMVRNLFCAPDTAWVLSQVFGCKTAATAVPEKHCRCSVYDDNKRLFMYRNPVSDPAFGIRMNVAKADLKYPGLFLGTTIFMPAYGSDMTLFQMDYDGDHLSVSDDEHLIKDAISTIKQLKIVPIYFEAMDSHEVANYSYEEFKAILRKIVPAPIGIYAIANVKSIAVNS